MIQGVSLGAVFVRLAQLMKVFRKSKKQTAKITSGLYLAILSRNHFVSEKSFNKKGAK